jgi:hypothetical protein
MVNILTFMLIAGAPFKEPIVPYEPFVMNTAEEIQQALVDLRNGAFVKYKSRAQIASCFYMSHFTKLYFLYYACSTRGLAMLTLSALSARE